MKTYTVMFSAIIALMTGCDTYFGPVICNNTKVPAQVTLWYSDGRSNYVSLAPGLSLWNGHRGALPARIVVDQGPRHFDFDRAAIGLESVSLGRAESAVIVFDGERLSVLSLAEAKKRGLKL